jgi:hypothetical protein
MKRLAAVLIVAGALGLLVRTARSRPAQAPPVELPRAAYLIRFGLDGAAGVDWSGSVQPPPSRIAGWQFDAADSVAGSQWTTATRKETYWDTPYERAMRGTSRLDKVTAKGVLIEYDWPPSAPIRVVTAQGGFSFGSPGRYLDGRAEVSPAPLARPLTQGPEAEDYPSLLAANDGALWLAYQSYAQDGDQIFIRRRTGTQWSAPEPIAEAGGDYFRPLLAQDRRNAVWVVWAAQVDGNVDLYARRHDGKRWSAIERLTDAPGPDLFHSLAADFSGNLLLAWQSARSGNFDIYLRRFDGNEWSKEMRVSTSAANDWEPFVATGPDGAAAILWDTYDKGNYDIVARPFTKGAFGAQFAIAETGAFEARATARYGAGGALWIVYDEGDANWGKDYGNIPESGRGLLVKRQTRVAVWRGGKLLEPAQAISEALPAEFRQAFQQPRIAFDGNGNPWVFFRYRVNLPVKSSGRAQRALWRLGATSYRGGQWAPLMEFPEGNGRIDSPAAVELARDRSLIVAYPSDGRAFPTGAPAVHELYIAAVASGPASQSPALQPFAPAAESLAPSHPNEAADIARVRGHRTRAAGRELRIARGDVHRHTGLSWDGNRDGSLHDTYRYALDAAGMDFLGVCDHQAGESIPYNWWMIQKAADLFTIPGRFAPLYSYERSLPYPNGHRNVLFAARGRPVLAISPAEVKGSEGAAKLYAYLRQFAGIAISHTSATGAGTDWRDSDAQLEPVVEIYQGYRNSYEGPAAPRANTGEEARRFEPGFVWNAWGKGIKLGVQSSSDHVSTHISYAAFYVDRIERAALLEAAKARRTYAATDNFIVEMRMGGHFMGEAFTADRARPIRAHVAGTGPLAAVELIRNNRVIYAVPGGRREVTFSYTDNDIQPGEFYYYVRARQKDGQLAWGSPLWVTYR